MTTRPTRARSLFNPISASVFGVVVVVGALVWWVSTGTPSVQIDADALVIGVIGLILVVLSMNHWAASRWVTLVAFWLAAVATGLSLAHASPSSWDQWHTARVGPASMMLIGSLGYLTVQGARLAARFHWVSYVIIVALVGLFAFVVFFLSRNVAIA